MKKNGMSNIPMVTAAIIPKKTPVPMALRLAAPGPEAITILCELYYKYGVLRGESHQHNEPYLEISVIFKSTHNDTDISP